MFGLNSIQELASGCFVIAQPSFHRFPVKWASALKLLLELRRGFVGGGGILRLLTAANKATGQRKREKYDREIRPYPGQARLSAACQATILFMRSLESR